MTLFHSISFMTERKVQFLYIDKFVIFATLSTLRNIYYYFNIYNFKIYEGVRIVKYK